MHLSKIVSTLFDLGYKKFINKVFNGYIPLGYSGSTDLSYIITPIEGIKKLSKKYQKEIIESGKLIYNDVKKNGYIVPIRAIEDFEGGIKAAKYSDISIIFLKSIWRRIVNCRKYDWR